MTSQNWVSLVNGDSLYAAGGGTSLTLAPAIGGGKRIT